MDYLILQPVACGHALRLGGATSQACNQMKYGRLAPPPYELSAVTVPLALISGKLRLPSASLLMLSQIPPQLQPL